MSRHEDGEDRNVLFLPFSCFRAGVVILLLLLAHGWIGLAVDAAGEEPQKATTAYPDTPEGVVEAYLKTVFQPATVKELSESGDVDEKFRYFEKRSSPGYDCFYIALGYKVSKLRQDEKNAKIAVTYDDVGSACGDGLDSRNRAPHKVIYHVAKKRGLWKIIAPYGPPHVSVKTAIQVYKRLMEVFPERRETLQTNIDSLKPYLKTLNRKAKEM